MFTNRTAATLVMAAVLTASLSPAAQTPAPASPFPAGPLSYGFLSATFAADGTFALSGQGWPRLTGTWKASGGEVEFALASPPPGCADPGKYRFRVEGRQLIFELVTDACQ